MFRKLILPSAISLALAASDVGALGLGELSAESSLNQPFLGEIELIDIEPNELDVVKASLASEPEFAKAGIERYFFLTKLRFTPQISPDGRTVLRVTSRDAIREPFVSFLIEVTSPDGRLVREYTALLDPPAMAQQGRGGARRTERARPATPSAIDTGAPGSINIPAAARAASFPMYSDPVPRGAGLLRVARGLSPPGASTAQTAMALYRSNQAAFINGNINRLRVGVRLVIPSAAELFALDAGLAEQRLAAAIRGQPQVRRPLVAADAPLASPSPSQGRLRIAGPSSPAQAGVPAGQSEPIGAVGRDSSGAPVEEELLLVREVSESTRQETVELRNRIRELEAQLADIQSLLALRNEQLAEQELARALAAEEDSEGPPIAAPVEPPVDEPAVSEEADLLSDIERMLMADGPGEEGLEAEEASPVGETGAITAGSEQMDDLLVSEDLAMTDAGPQETTPAEDSTSTEAPQPESETQTSQTDAEPPEATKAPLATTPSTAPETLSDTGSEKAGLNRWVLIGAGAGLAGLIGGLAWYLARRRRRLTSSLMLEKDLDLDQAQPDRVSPSLDRQPATDIGDLEEEDAALEPLSAPTSSETEDETPDVAIAQTSSVRPFDDESDIDIFSEADIYIAYGRYREAENLLRAEIEHAPGRLDLQFKLAEALFGMKSYDAFDELVASLHKAGANHASPEQWKRLESMQASLQPEPEPPPEIPQMPESPTDGDEKAFAPTTRGEPDVAIEPPPTAGFDSDSLFDLPSDTSDEKAKGEPPPQRPTPQRDQVERADPSPSLQNLDLDLDDLIGSVGDRPSTQRRQFGGEASSSGETPSDGQREKRQRPPELEMDLGDDDVLSADALDTSSEESRPSGKARGDRATTQEAASPRDRGTPDQISVDFDLDDLLVSAAELSQTPSGGAKEDGRETAAPEAGTAAPRPDDRSFDADSNPTDSFSSSWGRDDSTPWDEVATKLDLARAYLEMKDQDAARTILEEVVEEGNDVQRDEAKLLLGELE